MKLQLPSRGERRRIRREADLTGYEMAVRLGVSPTSLYAWETNRDPVGAARRVYAEELERLAAALGGRDE